MWLARALLFLGAAAGAYAQPPPGGGAPVMAVPMLAAHNAIRARVGVPPLVWSGDLAAAARVWAEELIATNSFHHRPGNRYGENLYAITGGSAYPDQVVGAWAGEARDYDIRTNTCRDVCGHYTQIVWGSTRAVGCAAANGRSRQVWVCEYDPPGNIEGWRPN